jgi:hypothetical protein
MGYSTKEKERAYYQDNKEKIKQRAIDHYWANRDAKREYVAKYQYERKWRGVQILGGICSTPGCNENHLAALQFHHRDPSTKSFNVTNKVFGSPKKYPWDIVFAEIKKCDLLCANCHFKLHSNLDPDWMLEFETVPDPTTDKDTSDT